MAGHKSKDVALEARLRAWVRHVMVRERRHFPDEKDFATAIGLTAPRFSRILSGTRPVPIEALVRIRERFHESIDEMVAYDPPGEKTESDVTPRRWA